MNLIDGIVAFQQDVAEIRRDIHAHPELRYEEHRTADLIAEKLQAWGIETHRGLGGTGVVGVIRRGTSARTIGLRADMDALPLQEHNQFAHRSKHDGRMHACGHDGHVAMLLAAARWLSQHQNFDGTVHLLFQPAEEGGAGAKAMIDDGLFQRFPCDTVYAMHNWPGLNVGQFGMRVGPIMASSNEFEITIRGRGGHAALPHLTVDPVVVASHLTLALQSIISRNLKPVDTGVLSVTQIHTGDATNIVPDHAVLSGTVRAFRADVLDMIEARMKTLSEQIAAAFNAEAQFDFVRNYPATVNHAGPTAEIAQACADVVGDANVLTDVEPTMGSEDFSYMLQAVPGAYIFIGNGSGDHREHGHGLGPCQLHNPSYDFNDALIPIGATTWVRLVERVLSV